jgi:hypothetical protein
MAQRFGGVFAPPLTADKLATYRELAATAHYQVRDAMLALCDMVAKFQETPESTAPGTKHPSGRGVMVPLSDAEVLRIWDVVPDEDELKLYGDRFEKIDAVTEKPLRDAAFHLLWYGRELFLDREPMTKDKL